MTDLSPAAQAVLTAVTWKKYDVPPEGLPAFAEEVAPLIAAALRAAADQVGQTPADLGNPEWREGVLLAYCHLLAIAAELEGNFKFECN